MAQWHATASPSFFTYLPGAVDKAPVAKWVIGNVLVEHIDIDKYIHNGAELYVQHGVHVRFASRATACTFRARERPTCA